MQAPPQPSSLIPSAPEGFAALSQAQERIWFLEQLYPGTPMHNLARAVHIRGPLQIGPLGAALRTVFARHAILRTRYDWRNGQVRPLLTDEALRLRLRNIDAESDPLAAAMREGRRLATTSIDIRRELPFRVELLRIAPDEHVLLLACHHMAFDGWSFGIVLSELDGAYLACCQGEAVPDRQHPRFLDCVAWCESRRQEPEWAAGFAYWRRALQSPPAPLRLADGPRRIPQADLRAGEWAHTLPAQLAGRARAFARERDISLFAPLLTAYHAVLCEASGQSELIVGTPAANRPHPQMADIVGPFVNFVPLRLERRFGEAFSQAVLRAAATTRLALAHQETPFHHLVREVEGARAGSDAHPLFQAMFSLQNFPMPDVALGGLQVSHRLLPGEATPFDIALSIEPCGGELLCLWEYATDVLDASEASALAERFVATLERGLGAATAGPAMRQLTGRELS